MANMLISALLLPASRASRWEIGLLENYLRQKDNCTHPSLRSQYIGIKLYRPFLKTDHEKRRVLNYGRIISPKQRWNEITEIWTRRPVFTLWHFKHSLLVTLRRAFFWTKMNERRNPSKAIMRLVEIQNSMNKETHFWACDLRLPKW